MEEQSLAALTDYRLIDLDELSDGPMIAPLAMKYQDWQQFTIPGGLYPSLGQRSALETLGVDSLLVAHAGLSDNDVFEIAEEISARRLRFSSISPLARYAQNRDVADARWSYPRHAGAERYLARDRPGFVERYAEVGAFAIALLAALASAWVALQRWRQGRHKDVLDEYLRSALAARAGARNAGVEELRATRERVVALQDEVFGLLIEERIHAGSDLTTFVTMSNQVLRELDQRRALLATATPVEK